MAKAAKKTANGRKPESAPNLELELEQEPLGLVRQDEVTAVRPRHPVRDGWVLTPAEAKQHMSGLDPMAVK